MNKGEPMRKKTGRCLHYLGRGGIAVAKWCLFPVKSVAKYLRGEKGIVMMKRIGTALVFTSCTVLSVYIVWGWLTIQDIRSYCAKNQLEVEDVLYSLALDTPDNFSMTLSEDKLLLQPSNPSEDAKLLPIRRFRLPFSHMSVKTAKKEIGQTDKKIQTATVTTFMLLEPFLYLSENVNHFFCSIGVGYMMGLLIVGVEFLKPKKPSLSRLILRPLVGALASGILLIVIISGGSIIWNDVAGMNGLSLGMIAIIGCVFCEKMKTMLTTSI